MDQAVVPLWAPQADRQLLPSPGPGSGLVFIYSGGLGSQEAGVGGRGPLGRQSLALCLIPPLTPPSQLGPLSTGH